MTNRSQNRTNSLYHNELSRKVEMTKRPKRLAKSKSELGAWIDEENLHYQVRKLSSRIRETAQNAQNEFWEFVIGSFPEVANEQSPERLASDFARTCRETVTSWFIANAKLDEKIIEMIKSGLVKPHEKKVLIGQNDAGWWAANPEPAIKQQDIEKIQVICSGLPNKDELLNLLSNLGYKTDNIIEGILKIK